jgi:hypothetical protein
MGDSSECDLTGDFVEVSAIWEKFQILIMVLYHAGHSTLMGREQSSNFLMSSVLGMEEVNKLALPVLAKKYGYA